MSHALAVHHQPAVELWRQAGTRLPERASPSEVIDAAGFYDVEERDLLVAPGFTKANDRKALVRSDTGRYLATVGTKYQVIQFSEVFTTVLAGTELKVTFRAAGKFGPNGVRAWMLGELPQPIVVRGDQSPLKRYILAVAGHDGATAVLLKNTAVRIWCSNSIGAALGSSGGLWRIHHTRSAPQRLEEVARGIRQVQESFTRLGELANHLAVTSFSSTQMKTVAKTLLPIVEDGLDHSRTHQSREKLMELFETGVGVTASIRGTGWAAVNAVTEFYDHHRPMRGAQGQSAAERRLESQWLGTGAAKKEAGLAAITQAVGIQLAA